eukprot:4771462-Pyramimonas_sp.AAC.1
MVTRGLDWLASACPQARWNTGWRRVRILFARSSEMRQAISCVHSRDLPNRKIRWPRETSRGLLSRSEALQR